MWPPARQSAERHWRTDMLPDEVPSQVWAVGLGAAQETEALIAVLGPFLSAGSRDTGRVRQCVS